MFITPQEILMGREVQYPLTPELKQNLDKLLVSLNKLRAFYGKPMVVSSGYRPGHYNTQAGGAGKSSHLTCEAADFNDRDRALSKWCLVNLDKLEQCGLYMESPDKTATWVHLTTRRPASGSRVFLP